MKFANYLPVFRDTGSQCVAKKLLAYTFPRQGAVGSFGAGGFAETFPDVRHEFRVSGCKQESRLSSPRGLEQLQDDWERGITQSCLPSQDHGNPWNRSETSLYLAIPESEP